MNPRLSAIVLGCFVAACGGGGGDSSGSSQGTGGTGGTGGSGGSTGGGSETVQGLELPEKFSVLAAQAEAESGGSSKTTGVASAKSGAGAWALGGSGTAKTFDEPDTAYSTDEVDVYVYDSSMEGLNMINEIVCYMGQTAAAEMVNQGAYTALVNEKRCRQDTNGGGNSGQTGQSSAGEVATFARWVVESERADNESPQVVKIWVPDSEGPEGGDGMGEQHILVELTATEGRSESRPFGSFSMNFKGVADGTELGLGAEVETMRGMLATVENESGSPQFRFVNLGGGALENGLDVPFSFEQAANVRLDDAEGTSGIGITHTDESWTDGMSGEQGQMQRTFAVAYDETRFASSRDDNGDQTGDEAVCRARDEFDTRIWRYGLYHREDAEFRGRSVTGGDRVELESGFPFSYDSDDNGVADAHGWLGYHGLWTETDEGLPDGSTIERYDYETDQATEYTVHVAPGRLTRRQAHQDALGTFVGDEFEYWGQHPAFDIGGGWLVTVDENLDFKVTAAIEYGDQGPVYHETFDADGDPNTPPVDVAATFTLEDRQTLWMWSQSLGGSVVYTHDATLLAEQRQLKYFAETFVGSGDETLFPSGTLQDTLYCYEQCLKGGLTQADIDAAEFVDALYHTYTGQPFTYTVSVDGGRVVLTDDTTGEVVDATGLSLDSIGHDWGVNTGEMLTEPLANSAEPWRVYDQPVSYRWETGPNSWNRMVSVTDASGDAVDFDRPLEIDYVHSAANDANGVAEFDGKRFLLHYSGFGDLGGFPWREDGEGTNRWFPAVSLADGTVLSEGGNDFVVKALEKEQSMRTVAAAECAALDAESVYADSSMSLPAAGDIGEVGFTLADRPNVTDAPAVIEGVVQ